MKPTLSDEIALLEKHDAEEQKRATAADKRRSELLERIQGRIKAGETTGRTVEDFMACCCSSGTDHQKKSVRESLTNLQAEIAAHPGQAALVVKTETEVLGRDGCFGTPTMERRFYLMGALNGPDLILDLGRAAWKVPTDGYAGLSGGGPTFIYKGGLGLDAGELLEWYGLRSILTHDGEGRRTAFVIGNEAVDEHFARHFEHEHLAKLAKAIGMPMSSFPENASRLEKKQD